MLYKYGNDYMLKAEKGGRKDMSKDTAEPLKGTEEDASIGEFLKYRAEDSTAQMK